MTMGNIDVGTANLFYEEKGSGQPVLFVHGIPTDYRAWTSQVDALSPHYRTITYSRRYAHPNIRQGDVLDSTIENNAADLAGMIKKLGIAPVHLVGHSYGGFIAAYIATHEGDLIRSLVLVEAAIASLLLKNPKSKAEALSLLLRSPSVALSASKYIRKSRDPSLKALDRGDTEAAVRLNLDGIEDKANSLETFPENVRKMMLDNGRTVREGGLPYPTVTKADLSEVKSPTLVINGETSALWLRAIGQATAASMPGCEKARISKTGHFPHIQNPLEFNARLQEFLGKHNQA